MDKIEEMVKWAENIPMEDLFSEIRRISGLSDLKFTYKVVERNNSVRIYFESQDLIDKVGFLKLMFKEIVISQFNSEVTYKAYDDEDEPTFHYWGTASFSYTHPSGGSNGCTFLTFWYDDRRGWTFDQRGY